MCLHLNGQSLPIAQLGPDFLILRDSFEHPPSNAEITLTVDNHEERWPVHLPQGLRTEQKKTVVTTLSRIAGASSEAKQSIEGASHSRNAAQTSP